VIGDLFAFGFIIAFPVQFFLKDKKKSFFFSFNLFTVTVPTLIIRCDPVLHSLLPNLVLVLQDLGFPVKREHFLFLIRNALPRKTDLEFVLRIKV
jgi:hypothetical protein